MGGVMKKEAIRLLSILFALALPVIANAAVVFEDNFDTQVKLDHKSE